MTCDSSVDGPLLLPPSIVSHLQSVLGDYAVANARIREAKSAQQQVFIVTLSPDDSCRPCQWQQALQSGCYNIVVRIWKGSARWWNLHSSHALSEFNESTEPGVLLLARAEVAGYRMARDALDNSSQLEIPQVLYFSHDSKDCVEKQPWAIMSYVGPDSEFFDSRSTPTNEWTDGMIKVRSEFGFDEPHPRWGRVPVDQCLDYVFHVLERFTLPMHRYFLSKEDDYWLSKVVPVDTKPRTYNDMVQLYKKAHDKMVREVLNDTNDETQKRVIHTLGLCIQRLQDETNVNDMPPVLCHMDCQPQNLVFYREEKSKLPQLHSVLDWEEAAFADPRFEILLLCRKVCANREQAQAVWDFYATEIHRIYPRLTAGSMEPWLKLETVHSIISLALQSMNLLNGGRSPWETKPDLLGKIEREFQRLVCMGWSFCDEISPHKPTSLIS